MGPNKIADYFIPSQQNIEVINIFINDIEKLKQENENLKSKISELEGRLEDAESDIKYINRNI